MRLGLITKPTAEGFAFARANEMEFIEICCNSAADADAVIQSTEQILDRSQCTGVAVSSVGRWNHDLQKGGKIDQDAAAQYLTLMDSAVKLGARSFVCGVNYDESISLFKNYVNALDFLAMLTEHAKGKDIRVAIQNCSWNNFIVTPKQWEVVLGENPDLYLKFDPSHAYNRHDDYLAELSDYGERVAHFHVKGTTHAGKRSVDDPPAGMDDIAWGSVFSVLYARGYNDDLSIEPHSATWRGALGEAGVRFTRDFIRGFMPGDAK